jgi:hypothetical protein
MGKSHSKAISLTRLPPEILMKIFNYLSTRDILKNIARVSKQFNALTRDRDVGIEIKLSDKMIASKARTYLTYRAHQVPISPTSLFVPKKLDHFTTYSS